METSCELTGRGGLRSRRISVAVQASYRCPILPAWPQRALPTTATAAATTTFPLRRRCPSQLPAAPMASPAASHQPGHMAIPVIDLSPLRQSPPNAEAVQRLAAEVDRACRQVGFLCELHCTVWRVTTARFWCRTCACLVLGVPSAVNWSEASQLGSRQQVPRRACCASPSSAASLPIPLPGIVYPCAADVSGHGVSEQEMQGLMALTRRLFDLPQAAKNGLDASKSMLARGCAHAEQVARSGALISLATLPDWQGLKAAGQGSWKLQLLVRLAHAWRAGWPKPPLHLLLMPPAPHPLATLLSLCHPFCTALQLSPSTASSTACTHPPSRYNSQELGKHSCTPEDGRQDVKVQAGPSSVGVKSNCCTGYGRGSCLPNIVVVAFGLGAFVQQPSLLRSLRRRASLLVLSVGQVTRGHPRPCMDPTSGRLKRCYPVSLLACTGLCCMC